MSTRSSGFVVLRRSERVKICTAGGSRPWKTSSTRASKSNRPSETTKSDPGRCSTATPSPSIVSFTWTVTAASLIVRKTPSAEKEAERLNCNPRVRVKVKLESTEIPRLLNSSAKRLSRSTSISISFTASERKSNRTSLLSGKYPPLSKNGSEESCPENPLNKGFSRVVWT